MRKTKTADFSRQETLWQKRWFRNLVLFLIAATVIILLAVVALQFSDQTTTILFINDGECPLVTLTLQRGVTGEVQTYSLGPGQEVEITVFPDALYQYSLNTESSEADARNMNCFDRDSGTLTLPAGSTQTIRVTSVERIEPTETPVPGAATTEPTPES